MRWAADDLNTNNRTSCIIKKFNKFLYFFDYLIPPKCLVTFSSPFFFLFLQSHKSKGNNKVEDRPKSLWIQFVLFFAFKSSGTYLDEKCGISTKFLCHHNFLFIFSHFLVIGLPFLLFIKPQSREVKKRSKRCRKWTKKFLCFFFGPICYNCFINCRHMELISIKIAEV
jgi:hypothetical protein